MNRTGVTLMFLVTAFAVMAFTGSEPLAILVIILTLCYQLAGIADTLHDIYGELRALRKGRE